MDLPSLADLTVALVVSGSALTIISGIVLFVVLHGLLFKGVPLYFTMLSLGLLLNYPGTLDYAHPSLKALSGISEGPLILRGLSVLLLGYGAALYHVGNSKCSVTKSTNALLVSLGSAGILLAIVNPSPAAHSLASPAGFAAFLTACATKPDACAVLMVVLGSLSVALGHYLSPKIEDYLANAGCSARAKVVTNAHGPTGAR